jgi:hypothetical protein
MLAMDITQGTALMVLVGTPHEISGWGEGSDCLKFPSDSELTKVKVGADGKAIATRTADKGGLISIRVLATAPIVDAFAAHLALVDRGIQVPVQFYWKNNSVGDDIAGLNGTMTKSPRGPSYGKGEVSEMTYEFFFEEIVWSVVRSKRAQFLSTITGGLL